MTRLLLTVLVICSLGADLSNAQEREIRGITDQLSQSLSQSGKKTVAVVDFTDLQGNVTELGRYLAEEFSVNLAESAKGIQVIDRTNLKVILQENKLADTGIIDPATARKLGQIAGVDTLVTGTITPFGDSVHLSIKILDTATARILGATEGDIPKTKAIEELLTQSVETGSNGQRSQVPSSTAVQSQLTESAAADIGDFHFLIEACRHDGESIQCWGNVTNKGSQRASLVVDDRQTSLVDNVGNVSRSGIIYNMSKSVVRIGAARTLGPGGTVNAELEPALPLVFVVTGVGLDDSASDVSIILTTQEGRAVIRNIHVRKH